MPSKKTSSSAHASRVPASAEPGLRQLGPKPDIERKAGPIDSLLRTGSWRGKAPAVAGLAPDIASITPRDLSNQSSHNLPTGPSLPRLARSLTSPGKSGLSVATPTKLNVVRNAKGEVMAPIGEKQHNNVQKAKESEIPAEDVPNAPPMDDPDNDRRVSAVAWTSWLTRSNSNSNPLRDESTNIEAGQEYAVMPSQSTQTTHISGNTIQTPPESIPLPPENEFSQAGTTEAVNSGDVDARGRSASWFGLWQGAGDTKAVEEVNTSGQVAVEEANDAIQVGAGQAEDVNPVTSSQKSWFGSWRGTKAQYTTSTPTSNAPTSTYGLSQAVDIEADGSVEEGVCEDTTAAHSPVDPSTKKGYVSWLSRLPVISGNSAGLWEGVAPVTAPIPVTPDTESTTPSGDSFTPEDVPVKSTSDGQLNLILPRLHDTLSKVTQPSSYTQQIYTWLNRAPYQHEKHVALSTSPPRISRAVIIGVHGFFPGAWFQKVFGPPTGTSIRFVDGAAAALEAWTGARGYSCDIERIALEGVGLIADRLETLWTLLLKWQDQIQKADVVIIACHSQGVPVGVSLMAKMVEEGVVRGRARLGITAMAGISLGPFGSLQSRFLAPANSVAGELFSFALPSSPVSISYISSLRICLAHGVRISYTGSIDDQLVSLESSLFATVAHPYIYRSVFVDSRIHAPSFLTHLVAFAIKVRNLGGSDHGLIRELSMPLAGSLYGGEGHSMIYQDQGVYNLGVAWTLESADLALAAEVGIEEDYEAPTTTNTNPFFLPWAMRGMLEEEIVKDSLYEEARQLLAQFEEWTPTTKALKDVKFRLEAVRTKLR